MKSDTLVRAWVILAIVGLVHACGVYTFSGSTLPQHLRTVAIPVFKNESLEPGIADEITNAISGKIQSDNQLKIITDNADASIDGRVIRYTNEPYTYGTVSERTVDISQYVVRIAAVVTFKDNIRDEALFEGQVDGEGIYDFNAETEDTGRRLAIDNLVERIIQNSTQKW